MVPLVTAHRDFHRSSKSFLNDLSPRVLSAIPPARFTSCTASMAETKLSVRVVNVLEKHDVLTVGDLVKKTYAT